MHRINALFICSRNQWRSPTAEQIYRDHPQIAARSCGTSKSARCRLRATDILWSDIILVMEKKHRSILRKEFPAEIEHKQVIVLDIPDEYQLMDPELIELIRAGVDAALASGEFGTDLGNDNEGENAK